MAGSSSAAGVRGRGFSTLGLPFSLSFAASACSRSLTFAFANALAGLLVSGLVPAMRRRLCAILKLADEEWAGVEGKAELTEIVLEQEESG